MIRSRPVMDRPPAYAVRLTPFRYWGYIVFRWIFDRWFRRALPEKILRAIAVMIGQLNTRDYPRAVP